MLRSHCANGQEGLCPLLFRVRIIMMRPAHLRVAVLKHSRPTASVGEGVKQNAPKRRLRPSMELAVDGAPLAELLRQGAPWRLCPREPENPLENSPMVAGRTTTQWPSLGHEGFKERPLRIIHAIFGQIRPPQQPPCPRGLQPLHCSHFIQEPCKTAAITVITVIARSPLRRRHKPLSTEIGGIHPFRLCTRDAFVSSSHLTACRFQPLFHCR